MWTRRQFLVRSTAVSFALAPGSWTFSAPPPPKREAREADQLIPPETRKAIDAGLKFLGEGQHRDGSFGNGDYQGNVGVTSLAGLAFLAAGHKPDVGPRGKILAKTLDFVLAQENRGGGHPGYLYNPETSRFVAMYSHGFGTLFLASLHGTVKDDKQAAKRREVLERAVKLIVACQNKEGGWRYTLTSKDADISVTTCVMMALGTARQSGLTVPKKTIDAGVNYIKKRFWPATGKFWYQRWSDPGTAFSRNAAALATLQVMGIHKGEEFEKGLAYLIKNKPAPMPRRAGLHYFYGHYYAARVLHGRSGKIWKDWYTAIRKELQDQQRANGSWEGRIDPHYVTAMACLVLLSPDGRLVVRSEQKKDGE
ncbi:MAG TPA: prenyltransferase/squalene oxidase repeat-containing protein [Gemmataceae bacterium]|nr:prenyltransferase/squalene oxidase repeat-containing protein [Gemmataceae bacterium]